MSVAGFNWQHLNQRFLRSFEQPVNLATQYAASVVRAPAGAAWRCIGIYHLEPQENNRRHNVFVDVLDEDGQRTHLPQIAWSWWMDAPTQYVSLTKPDNEPACDIPIDKGATITLRVASGIPSDSVGNLHTRWADEGPGAGNAIGHHSFYVVFQLQRSGGIITPPVVDPSQPPALTLEQRVERLEKLWEQWQAGK